MMTNNTELISDLLSRELVHTIPKKIKALCLDLQIDTSDVVYLGPLCLGLIYEHSEVGARNFISYRGDGDVIEIEWLDFIADDGATKLIDIWANDPRCLDISKHLDFFVQLEHKIYGVFDDLKKNEK